VFRQQSAFMKSTTIKAELVYGSVKTRATMKRGRGVGGSSPHSGSDDEHSPSHDDEHSSSGKSKFQFAPPDTPACLVRELRHQPKASQQQAEQDVYGINQELEIGDDVVQQLEELISQLKHKPAYDLAMELNPEYPRSLMIPFLRSVDGCPKRASKRITRHFETKLEVFGCDKLVKPIELIDLDQYDLEALNSGGFQVLPAKDRAGRPMLFGRYTCMKYREIRNMVRKESPSKIFLFSIHKSNCSYC
jgi:hypothetical protein